MRMIIALTAIKRRVGRPAVRNAAIDGLWMRNEMSRSSTACVYDEISRVSRQYPSWVVAALGGIPLFMNPPAEQWPSAGAESIAEKSARWFQSNKK